MQSERRMGMKSSSQTVYAAYYRRISMQLSGSLMHCHSPPYQDLLQRCFGSNLFFFALQMCSHWQLFKLYVWGQGSSGAHNIAGKEKHRKVVHRLCKNAFGGICQIVRIFLCTLARKSLSFSIDFWRQVKDSIFVRFQEFPSWKTLTVSNHSHNRVHECRVEG